MRRWVINIVQGESRDAVTKPKADVADIAEGMGYQKVNVNMQYMGNFSDEGLASLIAGMTQLVREDDVFLYQFPTLLGFRFDEAFVSHVKAKGAKVIVLMHDSEWLRGFYPEENTFLNGVDAVIGHWHKMNESLREYGVTTPIIDKALFDYVQEKDFPLTDNISKKVVVAGNLDKSIFVEEWGDDMPELHAYGNKQLLNFGSQCHYHGSFQAQELLEELPKDAFGISWDDNLPGGGDYQRYSRYNSPHKLALYLGLGLPVIVWKEAGIASYVVEQGLGFAIDHPRDIAERFNTMTEEELSNYKRRANQAARAIRAGFFTRRAIMQAEDLIYPV
ncbi:hypothetical protein [Lactococcus termiticola]|uniref:Beta-1,6-galactofuranosyltransferase n=1 Tax=Lactococcus termiticola TaxID=2169526 RepID=A0A2R5HJE7_9LACT|nr:hypothetical protein [Lactococcus termiticola]GBG96361.1 beta-1,6-galactofuranosyltransferase [Lactococcus termiticola]